jgi:hypothetical protein
MAKQLITGRKVVNLTSNTSYDPWYVGDFMMLTVSMQSTGTYPHFFPLQGSNADGFQSAIPETSWSALTSLVAFGSAGLLATIDPGFRWIRSSTSTAAGAVSAASAFTITFVGRT